MNLSVVKIAAISIGLAGITLAAIFLTSSKPKNESHISIERLVPVDSLLKSFKFEGCSGDWDEATSSPSVWKKREGESLIVVTKHPQGCGYDKASNPTV